MGRKKPPHDPAPLCFACGDPADWQHEGRPACKECWRELRLGVIPGPEILAKRTHVPDGVRIHEVTCRPGMTQEQRAEHARSRRKPSGKRYDHEA